VSFRLRPDEAPGEGLRRVASEALADAAAVLHAPPGGDGAAAVHEARKAVKKARAALRLGRALLPKRERRGLDRDLRALAASLASSRDATVRVATAREIAHAAGLSAPSAELEAWLAAAGERPSGEPRPLSERADAFDEARRAIWTASWRPGGAKRLRRGLERIAARGAEAFDRAGDATDAERLHRCRTHVKRLGYALRLLTPSWPSVVAAEETEVRRLAELLGRDHDRALVRAALTDARLPAGRTYEAATLAAALDEADARDRAAALPLLRRLFGESPAAFAARHVAWWSAWRDDTRA
jgi:CHAD domain-containing protein